MVAGLLSVAPTPTPSASATASATATPSPTVSPVASQASTAWLPTTAQFLLVVIFFVLVTAVWVGLVTYNQLASGRTLRRTQEVLGLRPFRRGLPAAPPRTVAALDEQELALLTRATKAATMRGTPLTRQLLALLTFSLIAGLVLVIFTENGADDLRKQTATALLTFLATIGGFYFGSDTAQRGAKPAQPPNDSPTDHAAAVPAPVRTGDGAATEVQTTIQPTPSPPVPGR